MERAEKIFQVLDGKKYTGIHAVYVGKNEDKTESDRFKGSELMGTEDNIKMALEGSEKHKVDPVIKLYVAPKAEKAKK